VHLTVAFVKKSTSIKLVMTGSTQYYFCKQNNSVQKIS